MRALNVVRDSVGDPLQAIRSSTWVMLCVLLGTAARAADAPQVRQTTPQVHSSPCALAEAMAGKLGTARLTQEGAQRNCQALAPTMNATDHAEFMRCCIQRLVASPPAGRPPKARLE
jgi:hypothetical protein